MFNREELRYLKSQYLARLATVDSKGKPNVVPVGFEFDGESFYVGSVKQEILRSTPKYRNVKRGNSQVAMVVDDLVSVDPWRPRGIRINGSAEIVTRKGQFGKGEYIKVNPELTWSWGIGKTLTKTRWQNNKKKKEKGGN